MADPSDPRTRRRRRRRTTLSRLAKQSLIDGRSLSLNPSYSVGSVSFSFSFTVAIADGGACSGGGWAWKERPPVSPAIYGSQSGGRGSSSCMRRRRPRSRYRWIGRRWSTAVWQPQMQRERQRQPPAGGSWASNWKPVAETRMGWHGRVLGLGLPLPACCMVIGSGGSGTSVPASGPRRPRGPVVSALPNHRWAQILCLSPAQGLHGPWPVLSFETSRPGLCYNIPLQHLPFARR